MASIDGTLSFNDYSTDQNESQMIVDLYYSRTYAKSQSTQVFWTSLKSAQKGLECLL